MMAGRGRKLNILYISQYFPPEMGAPSARVSELSRFWASWGHQVTVLTGYPNHPTGRVPPEYKRKLWRVTASEKDGIHLVRTPLYPAPNKGKGRRSLNYISFLLSAVMTGCLLPRKFDVVIATSPQLLCGLAGYIVSCVRRVPFIFEVRDLWPESVVSVGAADKGSLLVQILYHLANFLYQKASLIVVVSDAFIPFICCAGKVSPDKVAVVPNGVDVHLFVPGTEENEVRQSLNLNGRFVVSYIGTIGMAHGLEVLLSVAESFQKDFPEICFLLVGEGAERERLEWLKEQKRLSNVFMLGEQPREKIPLFINASDACLVLLKKGQIFKTVIPSKMFEFMSCSRPVILGVEGKAKAIMTEAGAGLCVEPQNAEALKRSIEELYRNSELRRQLGQQGRSYVLQQFNREQTALRYIALLESIARVGGASSPASVAAQDAPPKHVAGRK